MNLKNSISNIVGYRHLIVNLAWKELKVRYRRPYLGIIWSLAMPVLMVLIFQAVFSVFLKLSIEHYPFFIYLMIAVFFWRLTQLTTSRAARCLLDNKHIIKDAAFPREVIPLSIVYTEVINFLPCFMVMIAILSFYKLLAVKLIFILPLIFLFHILLISGIALLVSSLQVKYRDTEYIVEIALFGLFYLTPVFYPLSMVMDILKGKTLEAYLINPFTGILNLYRIAMLKGFITTLPPQINPVNTVVIPLLSAVIIFIVGLYVFKRQEKIFTDYISI